MLNINYKTNNMSICSTNEECAFKINTECRFEGTCNYKINTLYKCLNNNLCHHQDKTTNNCNLNSNCKYKTLKY